MTFGLIGEHLSHSYSEEIHRRFGLYPYRLIPLAPDQLPDFLKSRRFSGLNVTIPYKQAVIPFCDRLTPAARRIGAVNTLFFRSGVLIGDNTDYAGFCFMLRRAGIDPAGRSVLVAGSGGASRTVQAALRDLGARQVTVVSRNPGPPEKDLVFPHTDKLLSYDRLTPEKEASFEWVINTTPVGMAPDAPRRLLDLSRFSSCRAVADLIYNPLATDLLLQARDAGIPRANGLSMLVAQAAAACLRFTGNDSGLPEGSTGAGGHPAPERFSSCPEKVSPFRDPALDPALSALIDPVLEPLASSVRNLVLIGMPGCGKTTVGKLLARRLGRPFADTDQILEEQEGMPPRRLLETLGEERFRLLESRAVLTAGRQKGIVIATGGGALLRKENADALRQNGLLFFLQRDLSLLSTRDRPLSRGPEALKKLYETRLPLYNQYGDYRIDGNGSPGEAAEAVLACLGASAAAPGDGTSGESGPAPMKRQMKFNILK